MFASSLVNPPYQDPAVLLAPAGLSRQYLFDCGTLTALPKAQLLKITRVFVSHAHIDHLIGLDHLVRCQLFCDHTLEFYGPPPLARQIGGRLRGYTWNLVSDSRFQVAVHEIGDKEVRTQVLRCPRQFRASKATVTAHDGFLTLEDGIRLRWTEVEHGVRCLAYRLDWPPTYPFDVEAARAQGLVPGPWVGELKRDLEDGRLSGHPLFRPRPGAIMTYVADTLLDEATTARLAQFAAGSSELWCEATYSQEFADKAQPNLHATARQAAALAARAEARELHLFHFSRRYNSSETPHLADARAVFPRTVVGPVYPDFSRSCAGTPS